MKRIVPDDDCVAEAVKQSEDTVRFTELGSLKEINPKEIFTRGNKDLDKRIASFESWLSQQEEDPIIIVGHSVYFKRMLDLPSVFGNCDVWEVEYGLDDATVQSKRAMKEPEKGFLDPSMEDHIPPRAWMRMKQRYGYVPDTQQ